MSKNWRDPRSASCGIHPREKLSMQLGERKTDQRKNEPSMRKIGEKKPMEAAFAFREHPAIWRPGPRWNCYLRDIIATILIPLTFAKDQFESGVAAKLLNEFAANPYPYLGGAARKKMTTAHSDVLRKFEEFAFNESAKVRWQQSQRTEAHNAYD
jgi:hypothetical protein